MQVSIYIFFLWFKTFYNLDSCLVLMKFVVILGSRLKKSNIIILQMMKSLVIGDVTIQENLYTQTRKVSVFRCTH